jgi:hypothetical protein
MKHRATPLEMRVSIRHKGVAYLGSYYIEDGMIMLSYGSRESEAPLDGRTPTALARMMLREMVGSNPEKR